MSVPLTVCPARGSSSQPSPMHSCADRSTPRCTAPRISRWTRSPSSLSPPTRKGQTPATRSSRLPAGGRSGACRPPPPWALTARGAPDSFAPHVAICALRLCTATSTRGCGASTPAQGALAVQARRADTELIQVLDRFDQPDVRLAVEAERSVLSATGGTCRAPVGALASIDGEVFKLLVGGVNSDGSDLHVEWFTGRRSDAMAIAEAAGRRLAAAVGLR